jgi:hypothetical protein
MIGFEELTYVTINEQVTLQNQDPVGVSIRAGLKPWVIDLEALTNKTSVIRGKIKNVIGR